MGPEESRWSVDVPVKCCSATDPKEKEKREEEVDGTGSGGSKGAVGGVLAVEAIMCATPQKAIDSRVDQEGYTTKVVLWMLTVGAARAIMTNHICSLSKLQDIGLS